MYKCPECGGDMIWQMDWDDDFETDTICSAHYCPRCDIELIKRTNTTK